MTSRQPDQAVAIRIDCTTSALVDVWLGQRDWLSALRDGDIRFIGDRRAARMVLRWIKTSRFARPGNWRGNLDAADSSSPF